MKCPLCDFKSYDLESVRKHYVDFDNVDRNNHFFKKLFKEQNNVFHGKKCIRCNETYTNLGERKKYEITFKQHPLDYDFYNAEKLVDEFLLSVKSYKVKCCFFL